MFELDNRQVATLVWFGIVVVTLALIPKTRRAILPALYGVIKTMWTWKIIVLFGIYFAYATAVVLAADRVNFWHQTLFVDTLIVILFVGLPMLMNANKVKVPTAS